MTAHTLGDWIVLAVFIGLYLSLLFCLYLIGRSDSGSAE